MKANRIILIMMIIVVISIICIIGILMFMERETENLTDIAEDEGVIENDEYTLEEVSSKNNYYVVRTIVKNYYLYLTKFNLQNEEYSVEMGTYKTEEELQEERAKYKNIVYDILSDTYIQENNITISNIDEKLGSYDDLVVIIEKMYYLQTTTNITEYFITGYVVERETLIKTEYSMMVVVDGTNKTFEIYPVYEFENKTEDELALDISTISKGENNTYTYKNVSEGIIAEETFKDYIYKVKYNIEGAYSDLEEEYCTTKFNDIEEFKQFIQNNEIDEALLDEYSVSDGEYVCIDKNGRYYIFYTTSLTDYTVILDTYTIDIPEFTDKYNEANEKEKVILNLNKIMLAMNDKDYKYVYRMLADSFKQNYFADYDTFKTYMENTFFEENEFEYKSYETTSGYYTYEVDITDSTGESGETITKTFIMALSDGTDFEFSFNVE